MARATVQVKNRVVVGNDLELELYVIFFGTDTFATWKARRNAAIAAEAQRLGINWNGRIVSDADLLRDA